MLEQEEITQWLKNRTLDTLPKTIIIEGKFGSGKHMLVNEISALLNIPLIDMTEKLDFESISECYLRVSPYLYMIDSTKINVKNQNAILKFLEEPLKNAYIVLLTENKSGLLPTIINRGVCLTLKPYTKDFLKMFMEKENPLILELAETPGEIQLMAKVDINKELDYVYTILDKIGNARFSNILQICNHISFDNIESGFTAELFVKLLRHCLFHGIRDRKGYDYAIEEILTLDKKMKIPNINKRHLIENFLTRLWFIKREKK